MLTSSDVERFFAQNGWSALDDVTQADREKGNEGSAFFLKPKADLCTQLAASQQKSLRQIRTILASLGK
jgi:hypothetical protein